MNMRILFPPDTQYFAQRVYNAMGPILEERIAYYEKLLQTFKANPDLYSSMTEEPPIEIEERLSDVQKYLDNVYKKGYNDFSPLDIRVFRNKEIRPKPDISVRDGDCYVVYNHRGYEGEDEPNVGYMKLLLINRGLKLASANSVADVIPFDVYQRQDTKDRPRVPVSYKLMADLLKISGCDRLLTADMHAEQEEGFFDFPVHNVRTIGKIMDIVKRYENVVLINSDFGGSKRNEDLIELTNLPTVTIEKRRTDKGTEIKSISGTENIPGRIAINVEDMIDSGGTTEETAEAILSYKPSKFIAIGTHFPGSPSERDGKLIPAAQRLTDSGLFSKIIVSDSNYHKEWEDYPLIEVFSLDDLFSRAVYEMQTGGSVSTIFPRAKR